MTASDATKFWREEASEAFRTSEVLRRRRRHVHALFFRHLALEKLLKGLIVARAKTTPPPIHNLLKLAEFSGIDLTDASRDALIEVNAFNLEARYDDFKRTFKHKARGGQLTRWYKQSRETYRWLDGLF